LARQVNRRQHHNDNEIGLRECLRIGGHSGLGSGAQVLARHLSGWIDEIALAFNLGLRQVDADGLALLAEFDG
jgi:hypothetical protein